MCRSLKIVCAIQTSCWEKASLRLYSKAHGKIALLLSKLFILIAPTKLSKTSGEKLKYWGLQLVKIRWDSPRRLILGILLFSMEKHVELLKFSWRFRVHGNFYLRIYDITINVMIWLKQKNIIYAKNACHPCH